MRHLKTYEHAYSNFSNFVFMDIANNIDKVKNEDINVKNRDGRSLLMVTDNLEVAKYLIDKGVDINYKDKNNSTALIYQAVDYNIDIVKELIKADLLITLSVLVLSRKIERNVAQDYLELGIEFVFQKPVNLQSFKKSIEKSLRKGISNNNSI